MKEPARTLLEAVLIGGGALGVGLLVNSFNADGLSIHRDYFRTTDAAAPDVPPAVTTSAPPPVVAAPAPPREAPTPAVKLPDPTETPAAPPVFADAQEVATAERLRERGLQPMTHEQAVAAYEDPLYAAGACVFVDARKDEDYLAGHVPGAWQLDHYHLERYIDTLLPVCRDALQVVVYCHGKDCNDSELAALDLVNFGVDVARVSVYVGGWTAWTEAGLPTETGPRGGGGP